MAAAVPTGITSTFARVVAVVALRITQGAVALQTIQVVVVAALQIVRAITALYGAYSVTYSGITELNT